MDMLRCKSPELVRKEIWTHILAYNLIRTIMAQAATKHGVEPRTISFKAAIQTLEAFQPVIAIQGQRDASLRRSLYEQLLNAVAIHRVADRLGTRPLRVPTQKAAASKARISQRAATRTEAPHGQRL
jgi:hypothetical protein